MRGEADIQLPLERLKQTAEATILDGVELTPDMQRRILERIRTQELENPILAAVPTSAGKTMNGRAPSKNLFRVVLTFLMVVASLMVVGLVHAKPNAQQTLKAIEIGVMEISPAVAALGALMTRKLDVDTRLYPRAVSHSKAAFSPILS